jgi:hypothetical protein
MLDLLISYPWLLALIWAVMYVFDYTSTLLLARAYETNLSRYVRHEHGVELNPNFEKEIAAREGLSPKFLLLLALVVLIVLLSPLVGYLFTEFLAGALLLTWSFVNARHLRNYGFLWAVHRRPDSLKGRHEQSYWFTQKMLAADALAFSLLYLLLTLLTFRVFFLAGVLTCLAICVRAYRLANRKFPPKGNAST